MAIRKDAIELWPSAARVVGTPTATSDWMPVPADCMGFIFLLDVTAASTDSGDLLDVEIYTRLDTGVVSSTAWEICHFTQCLGNGGAKQYIDKILVNTTVATYEYAALVAGSKKDIIGSDIQCKYTITDGDADGGFTFAVYAIPL